MDGREDKQIPFEFRLTSGVDEDVAGHLGMLPLNQRLIKRTLRAMD